jgi:hypothetical protein
MPGFCIPDHRRSALPVRARSRRPTARPAGSRISQPRRPCGYAASAVVPGVAYVRGCGPPGGGVRGPSLVGRLVMPMRRGEGGGPSWNAPGACRSDRAGPADPVPCRAAGRRCSSDRAGPVDPARVPDRRAPVQLGSDRARRSGSRAGPPAAGAARIRPGPQIRLACRTAGRRCSSDQTGPAGPARVPDRRPPVQLGSDRARRSGSVPGRRAPGAGGGFRGCAPAPAAVPRCGNTGPCSSPGVIRHDPGVRP